MKKALIILFFALFVFSDSAVEAKSAKKFSNNASAVTEKTNTQGSAIKRVLEAGAGLFSAEEKKTIQDYFKVILGKDDRDQKGKKKKRLPPGLQKKLERGGTLPPGWQKKVVRGEVLDSEVFKEAKSLPSTLIKKLPKQEEDTVTVRVEGKIIRVLKATKTILDVFDLGF